MGLVHCFFQKPCDDDDDDDDDDEDDEDEVFLWYG